MIGSARFSKV